MKTMRYLLLSFAVVFCTTFTFAQVSELPMLPASSMKMYGNLPIGQLNIAHRQQLTGQFELALLTYNSALAWQPDWVPALAARAELLTRLGRDAEANRDRLLASRRNPEATAFFLAKGRNGLMPYLALYPRDWYRTNYGFTDPERPRSEVTSPREYFYDQYSSITNGPDTALAVQALQQKVGQDVLSSRRSIESLPRDYNDGVKTMLLANLAMLNHDYAEAVALYTDAALKNGVAWPELHYNRGLGYILLYNYTNGCEDLRTAAGEDFEPARVMYDCLCDF